MCRNVLRNLSYLVDDRWYPNAGMLPSWMDKFEVLRVAVVEILRRWRPTTRMEKGGH